MRGGLLIAGSLHLDTHRSAEGALARCRLIEALIDVINVRYGLWTVKRKRLLGKLRLEVPTAADDLIAVALSNDRTEVQRIVGEYVDRNEDVRQKN